MRGLLIRAKERLTWRRLQRLRRLRNLLQLVPATLYDGIRFARHANLNGPPATAAQFQAQLTKDYHRIEKGLALPEPRLGFGQEAVRELALNIQENGTRYGYGHAGQVAVNALHAYRVYHAERGHSTSTLDDLIPDLRSLAGSDVKSPRGGVTTLRREEILAARVSDFEQFLSRRHSVRMFSGKPVNPALLIEAVRLAQMSPSVCNRESTGVYILTEREEIATALQYQNGNRGFTKQIDKLLLVASELGTFVAATERYQHWIDGGMFAMTLVYALHSLGLGTCCLNWSVTPATDHATKRALSIAASHSIIMMIAVGHLPSIVTVAQSPRKPVHDLIFRPHGSSAEAEL